MPASASGVLRRRRRRFYRPARVVVLADVGCHAVMHRVAARLACPTGTRVGGARDLLPSRLFERLLVDARGIPEALARSHVANGTWRAVGVCCAGRLAGAVAA